ncbi:MAG: (2Fe-2S)-binding protein [Actinobacteria bacterium]|nr:(2Fe-2S)-binding protein [Actinomycetota bacterium]
MLAGKVILCLCQDVTIDDIDRAVSLGYDHPETIKRFTAAFMGPCQGKACHDAILEAIAARTGADPSSLRRPTARPPALPVRLGILAGGEPADAPPGAGASAEG